MGHDSRRRPVLSSSERARVLDELQQIVSRTLVVQEHLWVSSHRAGAQLTGWTEKQLDTLVAAAEALRGAVDSAPVEGD